MENGNLVYKLPKNNLHHTKKPCWGNPCFFFRFPHPPCYVVFFSQNAAWQVFFSMSHLLILLILHLVRRDNRKRWDLWDFSEYLKVTTVDGNQTSREWRFPTWDVGEIPLQIMGITYQPQLVSWISEPSTVSIEVSCTCFMFQLGGANFFPMTNSKCKSPKSFKFDPSIGNNSDCKAP